MDDTRQKLEEATKEKDETNRKMSLNTRYEELVRLAGACMDKDREIQELRNEIHNLQQELEEARAQAKSNDDRSYGSLSSMDEKDEQTFWGAIFRKNHDEHSNKGSHSRNSKRGSVRQSDPMTAEDASALRGVNELLRKELESACSELNETKRQLAEEMERSAQDMEAFAEALRGVDELRTAAEMMSRELTRIKKKKKWASYRNANELELDDDDQSVISMATTQLEDANKTINRHRPSQRQIMNPIWNKIENQNAEPPMDAIDEDGPKFVVFGRSKSKKTNSRAANTNNQHNFKSGTGEGDSD